MRSSTDHMIKSLCGSGTMGSLKSDHQKPTTESKKTMTSSTPPDPPTKKSDHHDHDHDHVVEQIFINSLTQSSLSFPTIKFEEVDDVDVGGGESGDHHHHDHHVNVVDDQILVQYYSPLQYHHEDDSSSWEAFFSEIVEEEGDFMIQSPVRNINNVVVVNSTSTNIITSPSPSPSPSLSPPQASSSINSNNIIYNYNLGHSLSLSGSPPRGTASSQLLGGAYSSTNKGKGQGQGQGQGLGLSPLQRVVFNSRSPKINNQLMYMKSDQTLSLPALESFLDDDDDDDFKSYSSSAMKSSGGGGAGNGNGSSSESFETTTLTTVPALLDCLTQPNINSSRFCGTSSMISTTENSIINSQGVIMISSTTDQESNTDIYNNQMSRSSTGTGTAAPILSQPLENERQQEKHQCFNHSLVVPLSIAPEQEVQDSGLQLVHLLLACAEAVAKEDYMLARRYLHHLNRVVTPLGDSMQRVASCFTEALSARLAATLTTKPTKYSINIIPKPFFTPFPSNSLEILKIYQILYQACPYIKFAHFTANQAIFEAFESEERVHVIDLDILQGYQWPAFMQALAARPGGAPFLRITGIGSSPDFVRETGRCLTELAHNLHVPFEFHPVGEELENLKPHMFNRRVGEALAVSSVSRLHRVPPNCLGNILAMVRDQAPNIVTIVEQEASHNGPYFLGRFLEAMHYYSAIFDSLDATFPPDSSQRAQVEQYIFAPEILNIVACEGVERAVRHERLDKWRRLMEGKGFKGVPLSANAVTQSKILLGLYSCDGYRLTEDKDCLLLGWQDRAILAASAWRC